MLILDNSCEYRCDQYGKSDMKRFLPEGCSMMEEVRIQDNIQRHKERLSDRQATYIKCQGKRCGDEEEIDDRSGMNPEGWKKGRDAAHDDGVHRPVGPKRGRLQRSWNLVEGEFPHGKPMRRKTLEFQIIIKWIVVWIWYYFEEIHLGVCLVKIGNGKKRHHADKTVRERSRDPSSSGEARAMQTPHPKSA